MCFLGDENGEIFMESNYFVLNNYNQISLHWIRFLPVKLLRMWRKQPLQMNWLLTHLKTQG